MLEVKNLHVTVDGKQILKGLDLTVNKGEVHAIMGPNGSGKSTLAYVMAGKPGYEATEGQILLDGEDILPMQSDERAAKGLFLAFQYPLEIPGVATMTFLRTALNAQRKQRGQTELSTPEFLKLVREAAGKLEIDMEMLRRGVNVGFSGGEKKRNEILQMALLQPRLCVLDETDSGLDIDALKIVSDGVNRLRSPDRSMVVITHYQRLLDHIVPDVVHVLSGGRKVVALRDAAFGRFDALGLPHRRVEEWKYTDLRALIREAKPIAGPPDAAGLARAKNAGRLAGDIDARRIVFVDGRFAAELSDLADLSAGLSIRPMAQALAGGDPL